MGRSVSYPSGSIVAFTVLEVEDSDDWEFEYEWLRDDLRERAARAFPSLVAHDGWRGREDRILMRNAYADFGVSIYGSEAAHRRGLGGSEPIVSDGVSGRKVGKSDRLLGR